MATVVLPDCPTSLLTGPSLPTRSLAGAHVSCTVANFGLVGAAAFDAFAKGPDVISLKMTGTMTVYSGLFMLFAWRVQPRNYLLLSCHTMNVGAQLYQLRRGLAWRDEQLAAGKEAKENFSVPLYGAIVAAVVGLGAAAGPIHKAVSKVPMPDIVTRFMNHPAGPFTVRR